MTAIQLPVGATSAPDASLVFKVATEPWEFDLVHRLNYQTFVEEIPQHAPNPDGRLVDKFHAENTYLICLQERQLVGMIAVRGKRPFSLDQKLPDLDELLPPAARICEYRLLSVTRGYRKGRVFVGLLAEIARYCLGEGYDLAIISGTTRQAKLYEHIGFVPFGPLVGAVGAQFQPMYLTLATAEQHSIRLLSEPWGPFGRNDAPVAAQNGSGGANVHRASTEPVNLLPGPVGISLPVRDAFASEPMSHRAEHFAALFAATRDRLRRLTRAERVDILMGSGTLANDTVCAQLSLLPGRGVVLVNGEFGERLVDHATRFGFEFEVVQVPWGDVFGLDAVAERLDGMGDAAWLWAVHCETSTGVLNDLAGLKRLTSERNVRLAMDCISSIGTLPVDLAGVYLASGVSGKGLASFPGLCLVFADHPVPPTPGRLPRYLDLGAYAASDGIPYTISSNLVAALHAALAEADGPDRFAEIAELAAAFRTGLQDAGYTVVAPLDHAAPAVLTLALPPDLNSNQVGSDLRDAGYLLSYQSRYLVDRNWIQICLMGGDLGRARILPLLDLLPRIAR